MLREYYGSNRDRARHLCDGTSLCHGGVILEGVLVEIPGIALGAVGYGLGTRSGDRARTGPCGGHGGAVRGLDGDPFDRHARVVPGVLRVAARGEHSEQ